jgi:capsular exopolysaccharide synthesis family protein
MIIACPIVAALAAGIVSFLLPPVYEAHVSLYVRPAQPLSSTDPTIAAVTADQVLRTYAALMTQRPILEAVSSQLTLGMRPEDLAQKIKATPSTNTLILDVAVQDTNPAVARDIANQVVADLIDEVKKIQQAESQGVANSRTGDNLVITSPAVLPDKPVFPHKTLNVTIAFAAGLMLALGIAFLLDYLDQSIKTDDELIGRIGLVPLGHIAYMPVGKTKRSELVALDVQSPSSEAFKALRTSVLFATVDQELKAIVITSAELGEGKSRTAANLAIALAQAGYKTLLIDADFRRPSQHRMFGQVRNVGLTNLIIQDASEGDAIKHIEAVPNLWLLPSGPTPPNPSELLGSARMREVMSKLWRQFSYVIIDTPPVNAVTDASIIAASANATIVVVEQGRTTLPALKHAREMLDRVNARTIGAVMNKVRATSGSYYYGYGNYQLSANGDGKSAKHQAERSRAEDSTNS